MKSTLILMQSYFFIVICAFNQDIKDEITEKRSAAAQKCIAVIGTNEDDVADVMEWKPVENEQTGCLMACLQKEFDLLINGEMNTQGYFKYLKPLYEDDPMLYRNMTQIIEMCESETKNMSKDECKMATLILACFSKHAAEMNVDLDAFN